MRHIPTIDEAIAAVEARLDAHRRQAHQGGDGFHDCVLCGLLQHRLGKCDSHKRSGGSLLPVKGLMVDPVTQEMSVMSVLGTISHDQAKVDDRIAHTLRSHGFGADEAA